MPPEIHCLVHETRWASQFENAGGCPLDQSARTAIDNPEHENESEGRFCPSLDQSSRFNRACFGPSPVWSPRAGPL